jgi:ComF family protein
LLIILGVCVDVKLISGPVRTFAEKIGIRGVGRLRLRRDCLLCLGETSAGGVCQNCEHFLAPAGVRCPRCALPLAQEGACGDCLRLPPAFDDIVTAFDYRFPVDRLVRRFKFSGDLAVGVYLGEALARRVAASGARPDFVLASPASAARLRERGFDAALLLARRVRSRLGLRLDARSLVKVRHTPAQAGLSRGQRQDNLRDAFAVRRPFTGLHLAVVDDVMTTGVTLSSLATLLRRAGARRVSGWVVARTPEPAGGG